MEQKNYTLKECRAFNQKSLELTKESLKSEAYKGLILPDEVHPWKILHSVIDQFYKRELERAKVADITCCEMEELKKLRADRVEQLGAYSERVTEIIALNDKNYELKERIRQLEKQAQEQPNALQELIEYYGINSLIDGTGEILDGLITAVEHSGYDGLTETMRYARALQGLFMKLEKELS